VLHLGGCAFGPLVLATGLLWWIDILLGTFSYSLILPLAALGLLQGLAGSLAMALLSSNLLRRPGVGSPTRSFMTTCRRTFYTIVMHHYAAALFQLAAFSTAYAVARRPSCEHQNGIALPADPTPAVPVVRGRACVLNG